MESVVLNAEFRHLAVSDFDALRVRSWVQGCPDAKPLPVLRVADEIDDHAQRFQRAPAPIPGDVAEHLMFDLVPSRQSEVLLA